MTPRRRRRKANPEWVKLRRVYDKDGTYERLYELQGGVCAICGAPPKFDKRIGKVRRLDLDHDHKTLEIRGLLCRFCNMRLRKGWTVEALRASADYLDSPPAKQL